MPAPAKRDLSAVNATVTPLGGGGGPLDGGYELPCRYKAEIDDPAFAYLVTLVVNAQDGRLACESVQVCRRDDGPPVTGTALRTVVVNSYMQYLTPGIVMLPTKQEGEWRHYRLIDEHEAAEVAKGVGRRRPAEDVLPSVARIYREALGDPDPRVRRSPTATVARRLHYHRGHAARLVSKARSEGLLGPARSGLPGERTVGAAP